MSNVNEPDSRAVATLRARFKLVMPGYHASPRALGRFAGERGIKIRDFGAHSKRWIRLFKEAQENSQPLT